MGQYQINTLANIQLNNKQINNFNPQIDEFQSQCIQRMKETPFINSQLYSLNPSLHIDSLGIKLIQLIIPRFSSRQLFPEPEIYKMLKSLVTGLIQLKQKGFKGHGDISVHTVYYCKNKKMFKLQHPKLCQSGYLLARHGKRFSTLSPEQLLAMSNESENDEVSFTSDIFSLGVLLCQVSTLTPSSEIYCPESYKIFDEEIQNRMKLIQDYYSSQLMSIIAGMVHYDTNERLELNQIMSIINVQPNVIAQNVKPQKEMDYPVYHSKNY